MPCELHPLSRTTCDACCRSRGWAVDRSDDELSDLQRKVRTREIKRADLKRMNLTPADRHELNILLPRATPPSLGSTTSPEIARIAAALLAKMHPPPDDVFAFLRLTNPERLTALLDPHDFNTVMRWRSR